MRLHYIQHVPFEGPAAIEAWATGRGHSLSRHRAFEGDSLPDPEEVDGLIIMGGPMGVGDGDKHPWLNTEVDYIRLFIELDKPMLGICLGAQLIAHALGAPVTKNPHKEIGWFSLSIAEQAKQHPLGKVFPDELIVFHWHGDTFAIPTGAIPLASSEACQNQGFIYGKVLGLQFHVEATPAWAKRLIANCSDELDNSTFVQTGQQMLAEPQHFETCNAVMAQLLDTWITFG